MLRALAGIERELDPTEARFWGGMPPELQYMLGMMVARGQMTCSEFASQVRRAVHDGCDDSITVSWGGSML